MKISDFQESRVKKEILWKFSRFSIFPDSKHLEKTIIIYINGQNADQLDLGPKIDNMKV